jgi:hypothetical protein
MSFKDDVGEGSNVELDEALREFRLSVYGWSQARFDAVMNRPRSVAAAAPHRQHWRLAAAWALSCVLIAGVLSGGVYERHHLAAARMEQARIVAARAAEQQRVAAVQRDKQLRDEEENLLASVDSDVSREVPRAMEPLTQLMDGEENR